MPKMLRAARPAPRRSTARVLFRLLRQPEREDAPTDLGPRLAHEFPATFLPTALPPLHVLLDPRLGPSLAPERLDVRLVHEVPEAQVSFHGGPPRPPPGEPLPRRPFPRPATPTPSGPPGAGISSGLPRRGRPCGAGPPLRPGRTRRTRAPSRWPTGGGQGSPATGARASRGGA